MRAAFLVNDRFLVNPGLQIVVDQNNGRKIRMDARLIMVMCLLADNKGRLVTREKLIGAIWNDDARADLALNQAISFLRKLLEQPGRQNIDIVSTKGYILNADISDPAVKIVNSISLRERILQPWRIISAAVLLIALGITLFWASLQKQAPGAVQPNPTPVPRPAAKPPQPDSKKVGKHKVAISYQL